MMGPRPSTRSILSTQNCCKLCGGISGNHKHAQPLGSQTHFWQQITRLHPSGCTSEKWGPMVPRFDITDMRLQFAHRNVSHALRPPPHSGCKLTELVDNFLRGPQRPKKIPPTEALLVSDGSPDFGAPWVHPGCQPPSTEGCCRDARSPGPRLPHDCCPTTTTTKNNNDDHHKSHNNNKHMSNSPSHPPVFLKMLLSRFV